MFRAVVSIGVTVFIGLVWLCASTHLPSPLNRLGTSAERWKENKRRRRTNANPNGSYQAGGKNREIQPGRCALPNRNIKMKTRTPTAKLAALLVMACLALSARFACAQAIVGNITFTGSVNLDTTSVNSATMVTGWHGLGAGGLPQVQDVDGTFASFVTPGDATTFHAPWSFNSGSISSFWSVDGFTFDLLSSTITHQANGTLDVIGTGTVSHAGFTPTAGTFNFSTQDPSANSKFSFSAATAVPENSTTAFIVLGGALLAGLYLRQNRRTTD